MSAFVGVIGINRPVDEETATEIAKTFVEWIAAPGYSQQALAILGATEVVAADRLGVAMVFTGVRHFRH